MKSILVLGLGRFGRHLAHKLQQLGNEVMVIDKDEALVEKYSNTFTDAQIGDCTDEAVIRSLGVNQFDVCFVTICDDFQSSLVTTSLVKKMGARHVVAKAKKDIQAEFLKKIGANEVIYPEREIAENVAMRYNSDNIFDYIELTSEYSIYEIPILPEWAGKNILELNIRKEYRINIIAIKYKEHLEPMPGPDYEFRKSDHVVVLGKSDDIFRIAGKAIK